MTLAAHASQPSGKPRVIVADDSAEQRWLVHEILDRLGFQIMEAADGRELFWALERCQRLDSLDSVVVIADVHMPVYGGLEVLEAWKDGEWPHPFVVMTAFPNDAVARRTSDLGAILLPKPFTSGDLSRIVRSLTH